MKIKKSPIYLIVAALISIILITGSPFQITNNLVTNNGNLPIKIIGQDVYGQGDDGDGGDDGGDDSSDSDDSGDSDDGGDEADDGGEEESDESEELKTSSEEATEEEEESEEYNPNNVDSDGDGLYDDEEPTEEEIKASEAEEDDTETNNEDRYRDITTAGEDVEGFERFVEEKKGNDYNFEKDYHWESAEDQSKLEKEFNDMKLKRAGEDLKPSEPIPIKGGPVIVEKKCDGKWKDGKCEKDDNKPDKKVIVKKYYRDRDDDDNDNDNDVDDLAGYNMGYRNGKFDKINKMPFNDAFPFDDKDGQTWYKIGYRSGWDSGK